MRRRRTAQVAAALALATSIVTSPASGAQPETEPLAGRVGLNGHLVWLSERDSRPHLERARSAGFEWVREELPWPSVEPRPGVFDWSRTDALMSAAATTGVNVLGLLGYSAGWASSDPSGRGDTRYPPRNPADYARYALEVVKRYGPRGTFWSSRPELTPRPLTAVELWNEPFGYWAWKPNPDPAAYARLVRAAATAIRSYDPSIDILVAGNVLQVRTDRAIRSWLREVIADDPAIGNLFDAYSVHPYPHPRTKGPYDDRGDARWDYRQAVLSHELDPAKPMWITEIGWSTAPAADDAVSEEAQASFVQGAVRRGLGDWGAWVERVFVYSMDLDRGPTNDREGYYGLRRADGSPKPAWDALVRLVSNGRATPLSAETASVRVLLALRKTPAERTPAWFWRWANWRLGTGAYQRFGRAHRAHRPAQVPRRVPGWAWRRLRHGSLGRLEIRGSVQLPEGAARTGRVVVLARAGKGWQRIGSRTASGSRFRVTAKPRRWRGLSAVRVVFDGGAWSAVSPELRLAPR